MTPSRDILRVNVLIDIAPEALATIVENAKRLAGHDEQGIYRVDTADKVGEMISRFLQAKDFVSWVKDIDNYSD